MPDSEKPFEPPEGYPPYERILAAIDGLRHQLDGRPWLQGRIAVDPLATNYTVNALATVLIRRGLIEEAELDYFAAVIEYTGLEKLEQRSRKPPADRALRDIVLPGSQGSEGGMS